MKISQVIKMLVKEINEYGDSELTLYDSYGDIILFPKSFSYGSYSAVEGHEDSVSFSDVE